MRKLLLLFTAVLLFQQAFGQDFEEGKYDSGAMGLKSYAKDTSAHAVVIREYGSTRISDQDKMQLIHHYHVKIKIFDSKGFDNGDVVIRLYHGEGETYETVNSITGVTFYTDDQGAVQKAELDPKKIYSENVNKHHELVKFAMPNLRNGCVIEYSYTTESPYHFNFHSWEFQSDIPKMFSEYEAHIPAIYDYNASLRGALKITKTNSELEKDCFSFYGTRADCSKITYIMTDIPAFIVESDMTSPANYISAIYFEESAYVTDTGVKIKLTKEWRDIDYELKKADSFGGQMKRTGLLKTFLPPVALLGNDTLKKAKAVYTYLQKWFKWNDMHGIDSDDGIKKALDSHSASVADINLALISALAVAGITADAVVLSTRDNGLINKLFPGISDFNYVVARVVIGNKAYLLDATDPLLDFGMLPLRCINDQGRVMSLSKPSYWINMVQSQKMSTTTSLELTLQDDGKIKGTIATYYLGYAGYERRKAIKKYNSVDEFVENLDDKNAKLKIIKSDIANLDSLSLPLIEKYDVVIDAYKDLGHDSFSFNPAFWDRITQNPFKLSERSYPVDLGSTSDSRTTLTMHYPAGFVISNQPAPVAVALPNQGGRFLTAFEAGENSFSYSQVQQLTKAIYYPEEYPYLKELYNKMIQSQKATVVFKKKI